MIFFTEMLKIKKNMLSLQVEIERNVFHIRNKKN